MNQHSIPEFGIARDNEERRDGGCGIVFDPDTQLYAVGKHDDDGTLRLFSGGVEAQEDIREGILREITEESGLYDFLHTEEIGQALAHYHNSLRSVNRVAHATCYLVVLKSRDVKPVRLEEHERFSLAWTTADELIAHWQLHGESRNNDHWVYFMMKATTRLKELGYAS